MQDVKNTKSPAGREKLDEHLARLAPAAPRMSHEEIARLLERGIREIRHPSPPKPRRLSPEEQIREHLVKHMYEKSMRDSLEAVSIRGEFPFAPPQKR